MAMAMATSSSSSSSPSSMVSFQLQQPIILDGGTALQVFFPLQVKEESEEAPCQHLHPQKRSSTSTSTYHACWLWTNDASNFMIPSGQKKTSPGSFNFRDTQIKTAKVIRANDHGHEHGHEHGHGHEEDTSLIGSVHPLRVLNDIGDADADGIEHKQHQWTLVITWSTPPSASAPASASAKTSYYNLSWLQQWSYDDDSIANAIRQREVNTTHTFLYKHKYKHEQRSEEYLGIRNVSYTDIFYSEQSKREQMNSNGEHQGNDNNNDNNDENYSYNGNGIGIGIGLNHDCKHEHGHEDVNEHGLFSLADAIFLDGAALLTNVPNVSKGPCAPVSIIGKMIGGGSLSHGSLYGSTFHVQTALSNAKCNNIAYSNSYLCPHQDLAYYESKPGFQLLHCITNDKDLIDGGESLLIDVMAAAHSFRSMAPVYFDTLTKCHATFVKQRRGACMTYTRPHIQLSYHHHHNHHHHHHYNSSGNGTINGSERRQEPPPPAPPKGEIVAVHWAPPFEGPLTIAPAMLKSYFQAYAAFELMVDKSINPMERSESAGIDLELAMALSKYAHEYTWEYRLRPGEMIVFNNTRMLHGRKEFRERYDTNTATNHNDNTDNTTGTGSSCTTSTDRKILTTARHLVGTYTNIDDSLNSYRVMLKKNQLRRMIPNVGNGTGGILPHCLT